MKAFLLALVAASAALCARAVPLERDLGLGLAYLRVHALPEDLSGPELVGSACVLDLRYVRGGSDQAPVLMAWLRRHAGPHTPVFLLANEATSAALLAPLNAPNSVTGLVILGAAVRDFDPDIAVRVSAATERRAYDALEGGAPADSLVVEKTDKPRNDEATLAKARQQDSGADDEPAADEASRQPKPAAPQLIDPVLQRAVQLHRSLLALKRI